jgi:hypothetical protein
MPMKTKYCFPRISSDADTVQIINSNNVNDDTDDYLLVVNLRVPI